MPSNKIIRECRVVNVNDEDGGLRIKVLMIPEDYKDGQPKPMDEIPWCFPLLPKHFHIQPKLGEAVLVINGEPSSPNLRRYFIGPLVPQQYDLNYSDWLKSRNLLQGEAPFGMLPDPTNLPSAEGAYPDREDISIQGRNDTDIILKDKELRLRCGFKAYPDQFGTEQGLMFNREDMAYIQMKYKQHTDKRTGKDYYSAINIVADKINLLSYDSREYFKMNDPKELIDDNTMDEITKRAHPLAYGDDVVDIIKQLIIIFRHHSHNWANLEPDLTKEEAVLRDLEVKLDNALSTSVRIN